MSTMLTLTSTGPNPVKERVYLTAGTALIILGLRLGTQVCSSWLRWSRVGQQHRILQYLLNHLRKYLADPLLRLCASLHEKHALFLGQFISHPTIHNALLVHLVAN